MIMDTGCSDCDKAQKQTENSMEMCDKHKLEYLEWVYKTASNEYEAALREYKVKIEVNIEELERKKQNELSSCEPSQRQ